MNTLLSVDFDFFFPEPLGAGDKRADMMIWDWNHSEAHGLAVNSVIWNIRAATFLSRGLDLPMCTGYQGFWDGFNLDNVEHVFIADSHALAAVPPVQDAYGWVVNFDAHHDAGYKLDWRVANEVQCDNWMQLYEDVGSLLTVVYPDWKTQAHKIEHKPLVKRIGRIFEKDFGPKAKQGLKPTNIYLCRSGAWVPTWCDDQFEEFVASFPHQDRLVYLEQPGWPRCVHRGFSMAEIEAHIASCKELEDLVRGLSESTK